MSKGDPRAVNIISVVGSGGKSLPPSTQGALKRDGFMVEDGIPYLGKIVHLQRINCPIPSTPQPFPRGMAPFPKIHLLVEVGPLAPVVVCTQRQPIIGRTRDERSIFFGERDIVIIRALEGEAVSAHRIYVTVNGAGKGATWYAKGLEDDPRVYASTDDMLADHRRLMHGLKRPLFDAMCGNAAVWARMRRDGLQVRTHEYVFPHQW